MAREVRKAIAKGVNATGDIIECFAETYGINSKIETVENLSEADIKGTEGMSLEEKGQTVSNIYDILKKKKQIKGAYAPLKININAHKEELEMRIIVTSNLFDYPITTEYRLRSRNKKSISIDIRTGDTLCQMTSKMSWRRFKKSLV